ncbi:hypothetical protein GF371_00615 [Candidatus Woesearchaeota archaeon]|nr:hypothetical protein [Candidatus Woesearchaeota archaeon]
MARKNIWLTKKQLKQRVIIAAVVIIILILLGLWIFRTQPVEETIENITEPDFEQAEQIEQVETDMQDEEEMQAETEEEPEVISNSCKIALKHAEDEVLDAYNIKRKAESRLADLEEQTAEVKKEVAEAEDLLSDSEEALEKLRESCTE